MLFCCCLLTNQKSTVLDFCESCPSISYINYSLYSRAILVLMHSSIVVVFDIQFIAILLKCRHQAIHKSTRFECYAVAAEDSRR